MISLESIHSHGESGLDWAIGAAIVPTSQGNINIHYVHNQTLKIFDDFKFTPWFNEGVIR